MKASLLFVVASVLALGCSCQPAKKDAAKAIPAVQLSRKVTESELAVVTLTPQAEQRLGIETAPAAMQKVDLARMYGGELILPLGGGGDGDGKSQSIYSLLPSMTGADLVRAAELQIEADGQVAAAKVQREAAEVALKRSEELVAGKAGVGRSVDEARAQVQLAAAALRTAESRRALHGAPLFDAINTGRLWVRVPIYVGELPQIKPDAAATVSLIGAAAKQTALTAHPVAVPFSGTPNPAISDVFYELKSEPGVLRPGMKVTVSLPLQGSEESLVVPAASILYDVHGNTWVYEHVGPQAFTRRRVELRRIVRENAILGRGPAPGAKIVTAGAAELFGTEFGAGK